MKRVACRTAKGLLGLLLMTALLLSAVACSSTEGGASNLLDEPMTPQEMTDEDIALAGSDVTHMEKVAASGSLELYVNMTTADLCVIDTATSRQYYSTPPAWNSDEGATSQSKDEMRSQILVEYYDSLSAVKYMNSFADSFSKGQLTVERIDNGVRVTYQLGSPSTQSVYPAGMRKEVYDELAAQLSESDLKIVNACYRLVDKSKASDSLLSEVNEKYTRFGEYDAIYIIREVGKQNRENLTNIFRSLGYTTDDAVAEQELLGYVDESEGSDAFIIPVEYTLQDNSFSAEIQSGEIKMTEDAYLTRVELLPYFGAIYRDADEGEGAILVPDGSGALIQFDNNRGSRDYNQSIYGDNMALSQDTKLQYAQQVYLPVFGMYSTAGQYLAVVEDGAPDGEISAQLAGGDSSYHRAYATLRTKVQDLMEFSSVMQQEGLYVFSKQVVQEPFRVSYYFLEDGADYVSMASAYRKMLQEDGLLSSETTDASVPFFLELIGAIEKRETILGVPHTATTALTTFEQSQEILNELIAGGVSDIRLRLSGWANKGLNNTPYSSVSPVSVLGGKKGFLSLLDFCSQNNVLLYPDGEVSYVGQSGLFSGFSTNKNVARSVTKQYASRVPVFLPNGDIPEDLAGAKYVLNPSTQREYIGSFLSTMYDWGLSGVSMASLGTAVLSDYNPSNTVDRSTAFKLLQEELKDQVGEGGVLMDGCNAGLLFAASGLVNMPLDNSRFTVETVSVPFYQMVVHGYLPYAGEPVNLAKDYTRNLLKSAESGAGLYFKLMASDGSEIYDTDYTYLYAADSSVWLDTAIELYNDYHEKMDAVMDKAITGHRQLQSNVTETTFEGGIRVIVNYNEEAVDLDGMTVEAQDFVVLS